jgi:hypothetical protein
MFLLDLLQSLPPPQLFLATLACGVIVGAVVLMVVRFTVSALRVKPNQVFTLRDALITGVSNIFALMVAFSAAGIWNDAIQARAAVQREANAYENIVALASNLPDALRDEVRSEILLVGRRAVESDWPAMKRRVGPNDALLERMNGPVVKLMARISHDASGAANPATNLLLEQLVDLRGARLQRETIARGGVSPAQWLALVILPLVALVLIVLAYHNDLGWQLTAGGAYVVAVCAALFVVLAHDRPFVGYLGVKPTPIELAMQRLQRASAAPPPVQAAPNNGVQ